MRARITAANDRHEREADRLADRAIRMPGPTPALRDTHSATARPLDPSTRAFFEPRFGHDFSRVRVHSDARAAASAQALNALAYTVGTDVVFAAGRFAPQTAPGRSLLAHELAHVVQQSRSEPTVMRKPAASSSVEVKADPGATCTLQQHRKIEPAANKANAWLGQTLVALDAFLAGAKTPAAQAAGAALEKHFHSTDRAVGTYVRQRLATIQGDIFGRQNFRVNCPPFSGRECDEESTGQGYVAFVPAGNPNEINLCGRFFERSEEDRASTIIHEFGHAQLGLRRNQEMIDREYKDREYYFYLTTGEALTNAESYAMFAREVATGSSPARGFIADTLRECPKPWIPIISDAITKARMWNHQAVKHMMDPVTKARNRFARAFVGIEMELQHSQSFKCIPDGSGRCSDRVVAYWYAAGDLRICPALIAQPTPDQRALSLLASLYMYKSYVGDDSDADQAAREARRLHTANVPATADVLRP